ncbi:MULTISPECIES: AAA family ATPase [unclassified Bradyrhizobium]|uniref:AAA family ATPase n=1 Tax=unclassified Bradyrhizobium TaxID=2631580 RepID=UPI002479F68B|nr:MULTISPECIES: AAA family ATPase [unclassified Bradyrhizobium]WGR70257.1 AAA family ATPase [Bradyrhizobium sp. ISRA426]WGR82316.1 AAA family ATPase [Bradyrhizobium sp. ISRA430]WGR85501.1 AAA family ATPase [Bradyrhizobium sp. ISRA432]
MEIGTWLRRLGLGQHESLFIANAIDCDVLPQLTEVDFEKIGIPLGDRKRLMNAISVLPSGPPSGVVNAAIAQYAERRHLTVMICDLVDSTALAARLDPEDMGAVIDAYHAACARITRSYDGFLADFRGDGILAYFGYPIAHEDDPERTVRAALDIIAAVARLETRAGEPLAVRIGIATGMVVVGDLGGEGKLREHSVVGGAPNIAARVQALVEPNTVVVADSTRRLLGDIFSLRDLGAHHLKGISEPVSAWAVQGLSASESRFEAVRPTELAHLIGRDSELEFLLERQRLARTGEGQIVLISGEPGIGKSRLAAALAERAAKYQPHVQFRYQCSPYHANSALHPVVEQLERNAGFKADDPVETRLDKLEALLSLRAQQVQTVVPLFAELLSIPFAGRYPKLELSPAQQRRRTLAALLDQFESRSRKQPILLLIEDVQWADDTTLELLDLIVERARQLPILALVTFRPEFEPPWTGLANVGSLVLGRLNPDDVKGVAMQVANGRALPIDVMKQIVTKTDGNPLFVEELTKAVLEAGILVEHQDRYQLEGPLPPFAIPETLHDSLMARLDRLHSVKEIAQIGATIGREFSYSLMRAVVARDETRLQHSLTELEEAGLIFRQGDLPDAIYSFKHALVRDAAYQSLLKRRRRQLHAQIARVLEEGFQDAAVNDPEILAHHFTEAGMLEQATDYWLKAGKRALGRSSNAEAVKHLTRGMELTQQLLSSPQRDRKELDFYLALGPAVAATEGDAAAETSRVFSRARALLGESASLEERMTILWGNYLAHTMRAEYSSALEDARHGLALAAEHDHPGVAVLATRFIGQSLHLTGAFAEAREHLDRALALCSTNPATISTYRRFGVDDAVNSLAWLSTTLLVLGYPKQSTTIVERTETLARTREQSFTTALALGNIVVLGTIGGDAKRALAHADEAISLSIEHEFAAIERRARFFRGALLAQGGDLQVGIELMRSALAATYRNSERCRRTLYLGHLAFAHAQLGEPEVGLRLLDEGVQLAEATGERFFEAELYRLRGSINLKLGRRDEAEAELLRAVAIARQQQARWWELRASICLARHWSNEGRYFEARSLAKPIYTWFTEGRDTPDLRDARNLVDELSAVSGMKEEPDHGNC